MRPRSTWGAAAGVAALGVAVAVAAIVAAPRSPGRPSGGTARIVVPAPDRTRPGLSSSVVVAAAGDIACPPGRPATPVSCQQRATADLVAALHPSAVLTLGDNQYRSGGLASHRAAYGPTWGRFLAGTYPTPGNHEYRTPGAAGYFDYFGARARTRGEGWYSYQLGAWHVVALNSNCWAVDCRAEVAWLRADLAAHPARCTLAYWHHPRFSSGWEGGTRSVAPFWSARYAAGADLVLNGHDHDYERFAPQDPQGRADPAKGLRELVVSTGGAPALPLRATRPNSQVRQGDVFGVLRLTLEPRGYRWTFVRAAGAAFTDHGSASCH